MNRLADTATQFRSTLRELRESCVCLVYFFQNKATGNKKLRTFVENLDSDLVQFLTAESDNDRIQVLNDCISDHIVPFKDTMIDVKKDCRKQLRKIFETLKKTAKDNELEPLLSALKDFFNNETAPDLGAIPTSNNEKIDEMWHVLTHLSRVCETIKALENLEIPPKMSPEQIENLRLQQRLDEANKVIAARDATIKRLQEDLDRMRRTLQEARAGEAAAKTLTSAVRVMPAFSDEEDLVKLRLAMQKIAKVLVADTKESLEATSKI